MMMMVVVNLVRLLRHSLLSRRGPGYGGGLGLSFTLATRLRLLKVCRRCSWRSPA
jgi:hypothetical protein